MIASAQTKLLSQLGSRTLDAISIGSVARSRLKQGREGRVQGVFDGAINLLFEDGLVSLVPEGERGPLNVTLRLNNGSTRMSSFGIKVGDTAKVTRSRLDVGDHLRISLTSATIYLPGGKFREPLISDDRITENAEAAMKIALLFGNMSGLGELIALLQPEPHGGKPIGLNMFASAARGRIARLVEAFFSEDAKMLTSAVRDLIGIGPGLTPSSDDMLAGLVLICVLYSRNRASRGLASTLIAHAAAASAPGRTTILSEEFLKQAALGRGNEPVMRLCVALLTGSKESVERESRRVLAIGETSGTDTVLGVLLGTMLCMGRRLSPSWRESE